jgi:hypothetical protein
VSPYSAPRDLHRVKVEGRSVKGRSVKGRRR